VIRTNNNSWPYVCDWNEDGRKDLLVGQEGIGAPCNVFVYLNQGTNAEPVFADSTPVLTGGMPIRSYRCVPVARDMDNDGRKDLVLGEWYSSVRFYRNTGTNAQPVFGSYINFVEPDPDSFLNGNPPRLCFTDWDGDNDQDMITCDYYGSVFLRRNITPTGVTETEPLSGRGLTLTVAPNPVSDRVELTIGLARSAALDVGLFDPDGRRVRTLFKGRAESGETRLAWSLTEGERRTPGAIGFVRARAAGATANCKLIFR
jgi:hypothetical protein